MLEAVGIAINVYGIGSHHPNFESRLGHGLFCVAPLIVILNTAALDLWFLLSAGSPRSRHGGKLLGYDFQNSSPWKL
jgi:hypothetical protein